MKIRLFLFYFGRLAADHSPRLKGISYYINVIIICLSITRPRRMIVLYSDYSHSDQL